MSGMEFLAQNAWKATAILSAAFAASWMMRRRAASLRHFGWTAAFGALLLLPILTLVTPKWGWRQTPVVQTVIVVRPHAATATTVAPRPGSVPVPWALLLWAAGMLAVAARFAIGAARTARMIRRGRLMAHEAGVPVLESAEVPVALAWGIRRPAVVLPVEARSWPAERRKAVLLHELMHVERRDLLAQRVGQAACCLYWFHPLAWLAARELRKERERASDDAVLRRGIPAHDYAAHLVELVRSISARRTEWAGAAGIADRSDLESRVRALLDRGRARTPLSRRAAVLVGTAAIAVVLPLASLTSFAQATRGGLVGVVRDPSGAVVPNCTVIAKNLDSTNEESTKANLAGEYQFAAIPAGRYELEYHAPGFAVTKAQTSVVGGTAARLDANLEVGSVKEVVTVSGQKPATVSVPRAAGMRQRIKVGGNVQMTRLIQQAKPVYPADAQQEGVEGTVRIKAVISKTGEVLNPKVISTVDPRLTKAALDAVSQWRYEPTLLNGEPVEVLTDIDVDFKLGQ